MSYTLLFYFASYTVVNPSWFPCSLKNHCETQEDRTDTDFFVLLFLTFNLLLGIEVNT